MSNFKCFVKSVPKGKKLHFLCGFLIALFGSPIVGYGIAFWSAILAGALKEGYDYVSKTGHACWSDFSFTAAGGFMGGGLATLISLLMFTVF